MNIQKTLDKCRAELKRQQEIEKAATPGPWEGCPPRHVADSTGYVCEVLPTKQRVYWDATIIALSRNLNPTRLRVAEELIEDLTPEALERYETPGDEVREARLAAVLLGVEVVE